MLLQFALILAFFLQFLAAGIAIRLTRVTKYNLSWILISIGFILMAVRRLVEFLPTVSGFEPQDFRNIYVWLGVIISFFFATGVFLIRKIFIYMQRVEDERRDEEKRLLNAIIQAEEKERKRFAKDLHDGLGPILSTVKMSVSALSRMEKEDHAQEIIQNTDMAINEAIKSIREISNNLSPHVLTTFGLAKAVQNFINKINAVHAIEIDFQTNLADERFDASMEVVLYRVLCELINNTIKHAEANRIDITMMRMSETIAVVYQDNGIGFVPEEVLTSEQTGMGYSNMFSRIHSLKGKLEINSDKKQGTKAYITVPTTDIHEHTENPYR